MAVDQGLRSRVTIGIAVAVFGLLALFALVRTESSSREVPVPDLLQGARRVATTTTLDGSTTYWFDASRPCRVMVSGGAGMATSHHSDVCSASDIAAAARDRLFVPVQVDGEPRDELGVLDGRGRLIETYAVPEEGNVTYVERLPDDSLLVGTELAVLIGDRQYWRFVPGTGAFERFGPPDVDWADPISVGDHVVFSRNDQQRVSLVAVSLDAPVEDRGQVIAPSVASAPVALDDGGVAYARMDDTHQYSVVVLDEDLEYSHVASVGPRVTAMVQVQDTLYVVTRDGVVEVDPYVDGQSHEPPTST